MLKRIKKFLPFKRLIILLWIFLISIIWANFRVEHLSNGRTFYHTSNIPEQRVGLVFGTAPTMQNGMTNYYFQYRIDAAVELYKSGKIKRILVSGDNSRKTYNEPEAMQQALIAKGVPPEHISLDYAGFDTYDSVIRAWKVFGEKTFVVISQKFQNERAIYIAQRHGLDIIGFNAKDVAYRGSRKFMQIREFIARYKAWIEVNIGMNPTYLGKREYIL